LGHDPRAEAVAVPFGRIGEGLASTFLDGDLLFAALG
jgi:hypothetical protein